MCITRFARRLASAALATLLPVLVVGCLEIDVRVRMSEDGVSTVTEKVVMSEGLLDLSGARPNLDLATLLTRQAIEDRLKHMGQGVTLLSHEMKDLPGGDKQSLAVYRVPDLNEFMYVSPFLAYTDYPENHVVKGYCQPLLKSRNYGGVAGQMAVAFRPMARPRAEARPTPGQALPGEPAPADLQALREVRPVFQDMLKGFKLRFTFESYAPIAHTGFGFRGYKAHVNFVDLIAFTDEGLDKYGTKFLDNEEIMLDLIRWKPGSANIVDTVTQFMSNNSVPIFLPWGSRLAPWIQSDEIYFPPSKALFDRHFAGKTLDMGAWGPGAMKPAIFDEIGWKGEKRTENDNP